MRIKISKTPQEFDEITRKTKGGNISQFLQNEIYKRFGHKNDPIPCTSENTPKNPLIHKNFKVNIPPEMEARIRCESAHAGVDPSTYITRLIVDQVLVS